MTASLPLNPPNPPRMAANAKERRSMTDSLSEALTNLQSACEGLRFMRGGHPREFDSFPQLTHEQQHREWCRARFVQILDQRRRLKWKFRQIGDFFGVTASRAGELHRQALRWEKMGKLKVKGNKEPAKERFPGKGSVDL